MEAMHDGLHNGKLARVYALALASAGNIASRLAMRRPGQAWTSRAKRRLTFEMSAQQGAFRSVADAFMAAAAAGDAMTRPRTC